MRRRHVPNNLTCPSPSEIYEQHKDQLPPLTPKNIRMLKILLATMSILGFIRILSDTRLLTKLHFPWSLYANEMGHRQKQLYLVNFPNGDEQARRLDLVESSYSIMACRVNNITGGISEERWARWRMDEWTIPLCGNNTYWGYFSRKGFPRVDFAQSVASLRKILPDWVDCADSSLAGDISQVVDVTPVTMDLNCTWDNYPVNITSLETLIIESDRVGHMNPFHDLIIEDGPKAWCIFHLISRALHDLPQEIVQQQNSLLDNEQLPRIILFEPNSFHFNAHKFSYLASLLDYLSPYVLRFKDQNEYEAYLQSHGLEHIPRTRIKGPAPGVIPSTLTHFPNIEPSPPFVGTASKIKNISLSLQEFRTGGVDAIEHCNDCVLLIQRDHHHRRMAGMNTGTLTEIVLSLLEMNFPVQVATLENLNVMDQIRLFQNARVVISIHGAAMTNLIWMRQNYTGIVEVLCDYGWGVHLSVPFDEVAGASSCFRYPGEYAKFDYFNLAHVFGIEHTFVESVFSSPLVHNQRPAYIQRGIYYVDAEKLAKKIADFYFFLHRREELAKSQEQQRIVVETKKQ